jgi:hypothetical protein
MGAMKVIVQKKAVVESMVENGDIINNMNIFNL